MSWFYKYDETTKELVPGAINSDTQPANSTAVDPASVMFPVWSAEKGAWISDPDKLTKWNAENNEKYTDPVQKQLATLAQLMMTRDVAQSKQIAQLQAQVATIQGGAK
ncbi:hypothetical protein H7198_05385 [Fructobacillus sp. CRL 2054]|uniref:hypothetical protein n=1 Tax=Fructobacillus sp. CRL 2054 TaxID=2763007 RepID=UPI00237827C9|nr:hypothetical protein [Fructobacillus sp. CRL 2054]MDD9139033.1 hypothetical protein [Fructobacillus sp. CRL 2054]